jgi:TolB-like protein/Flp pilus assembly protein TadD
MGEQTPEPASTPTGAVFLSYASQDSEAAQKMCDALRAAGIEVWFDKSELRGGDAWDRQIRQRIHDCRLFIAVISAHTEARDEGYFRREWRLAVERAGDMAEDKAFVVPVAIDGTSERSARVPDPFKHVQWTRLPGGETTCAFVERVCRLLSPGSSPARGATLSVSPNVPISPTSIRRPWRSKAGLWVTAAVIAVALAAIAVDRFLLPRSSAPRTPPAAPAAQRTAPTAATEAAFTPPPHSIAVLPFVNMSGDKDQEYFSEGLTEEILNSLAKVTELQVAARTSSFSFQGEHPDIGTVAHKLNVASVLEGSVRRSRDKVRITAQLVSALTGFHLWSETYDRNLRDVLDLQTEIATAVASALKVTLLSDVAGKVELGGTRDPAAFDAYLRGWKIFYAARKTSDMKAAIDLHSQAIDLDPKYALAYAARAVALDNYAEYLFSNIDPKTLESVVATRDAALTKAFEDAHEAIALAPGLGEGYSALGLASSDGLELGRAEAAVERALVLSPGNARVLRVYSFVKAPLGRVDTAITTARQALLLDPVNVESGYALAGALFHARRYAESLAVLQKFGAADPRWGEINTNQGLVYYALGNFDAARTACELDTSDVLNLVCLAITYEKIGRQTDAKEMLKKLQSMAGGAAQYQYARIYAQWGSRAKALDCLESALSFRDFDLTFLKMDPLLDPLRSEPRFQAVMRELKFP